MDYAPNRCRTPLHSGALPPGPLSPARAALVSCVAGCRSHADFTVQPEFFTVKLPPLAIPDLYSADTALHALDRYIGQVEAHLTQLRQEAIAKGGDAFLPQAFGLEVDCRGCETQHDVLTRVLDCCRQRGVVMICAGDTPVTRGADGQYRPVPVRQTG